MKRSLYNKENHWISEEGMITLFQPGSSYRIIKAYHLKNNLSHQDYSIYLPSQGKTNLENRTHNLFFAEGIVQNRINTRICEVSILF